MNYVDVITSAQYIHSFSDLWLWFQSLDWQWQLFVGIGAAGVTLILLRFIWATMPHVD